MAGRLRNFFGRVWDALHYCNYWYNYEKFLCNITHDEFNRIYGQEEEETPPEPQNAGNAGTGWPNMPYQVIISPTISPTISPSISPHIQVGVSDEDYMLGFYGGSGGGNGGNDFTSRLDPRPGARNNNRDACYKLMQKYCNDILNVWNPKRPYAGVA